MPDVTTLGDVAELQAGFAFKSSEFSSVASDRRLLRGDNVGQGRLRWDGAARWAGEVDSRYELRPGDVVLAMDRPWIGAGLKYAIVRPDDCPALLVQRVARLRARPGFDQRFLAYVIASPSFTAHILASQTGTAVPHVSAAQILSFATRVPPLDAQRGIAEVLGALDDKIAANDRVIEVADELRSSLVATSPSTVAVEQIAHQCARSLTPDDFAAIVDHYSLPAFDAGARPDRADRESIKSNKLAVDGPSVLMSKLNPRIPRGGASAVGDRSGFD